MKLLDRIRDDYSWVNGNIKVLLASYVLAGFASGLYYSFEPKYILALGATPLIIGLMNSVGSLVKAAVIIPGSVVADTYGRRRIIVFFTFLSGSSLLFYALAPDWRVIFVGTVIFSIYRVYLPALSAIEADSIPEDRRGEGFSLINLAPGLAAGLSPPIAGYIIGRMGLVPGMRLNYLIAFLCVLGIAVVRYFWLEETMEIESSDEGFWDASKAGLRSLVEVWREIPESLWALLVIKLLKASLMPFFGIYVSLYALSVIGVSAVEWGLVGSSYMLLGLFLGVPLGKLVDRVGRWRGMLLSFLFSVPFLVFMRGAGGFPVLMGLFMVRTIGQLLWYPAVGAAQADLIPVEKRGRIMGLSALMMEGVTVISSTLFGLLYALRPEYAFYFAIGVEALCATLIAYQLRKLQPVAPLS